MTDEPDDDQHDVEHEFVMPFVVVGDGQPYDEDSYTAGWEMGILAARLSAAAFHGLGPPHVTIHRANLPQVALVAMAHGFTEHVVPWADDTDPEIVEQWAHVEFDWGSEIPDGVVAPE